jgi:hypothetical protein
VAPPSLRANAQDVLIVASLARWMMLVGAVALLAGCGSSSKTKTVTQQVPSSSATAGQAKPTTKAQVIVQGDSICRNFNPQFDALNAKITAIQKDTSLSTSQKIIQLSSALNTGLVLTSNGLNRLRALTPPPQDATIFTRYVAAVGRQRQDITDLIQALDRQDLAAIPNITGRIRQDKGEAHGFAQAYGFRVCGTG